MKIRSEIPADQEQIRSLTLAAFAGARFGNCGEERIIERLRKADALTLSLVCQEGNDVVGHVAFSPVALNAQHCGWFGLGPISVAPARQGTGIGGALIREGLRRLRALEARGCVLVGDPGYYNRFGFRALPRLTYDGVPPEVFLGLCLSGEAPEGQVTFHTAFDGP
jgi:putative acetyltransferase